MYQKYLYFYNKYLKNLESNNIDDAEGHTNSHIIRDTPHLKNLTGFYFTNDEKNGNAINSLIDLSNAYPNLFSIETVRSEKIVVFKKLDNERVKITLKTGHFDERTKDYFKHYNIILDGDLLCDVSFNGNNMFFAQPIRRR